MGFVVSKVVWGLIAPANALAVALILALLVRPLRRPILGLCIVGLLAVGVTPAAKWLTAPLENRFPQTTLPEHVDGVIVLGGALNPAEAVGRGQPVLNDTAERMVEFASLVRRYPDAKAVFTGGSGSLLHQDVSEAPMAETVFERVGLPPGRVMLEGASRNTYENAVFTRDLVKPQPGEVWLLVTSAMHMPRSVGLFRKAGWTVVPYPCDFRTSISEPLTFQFDVIDGLKLANDALREYVGLVYYYLTGRTDSLFPKPEKIS